MTGILVAQVSLCAPSLTFLVTDTHRRWLCLLFSFFNETRSLLTKTCLSPGPSPFTVPLAQPLPDSQDLEQGGCGMATSSNSTNARRGEALGADSEPSGCDSPTSHVRPLGAWGWHR